MTHSPRLPYGAPRAVARGMRGRQAHVGVAAGPDWSSGGRDARAGPRPPGRRSRPRPPYAPGPSGSRLRTCPGAGSPPERDWPPPWRRSGRQLAGSPEAAGRISRNALHNALAGRRLPSEELLAGFAAACGAGEETTRALLTARARILAGPPPRPRAGYPCEIAEEAEARRERDAAVRHWIRDEDELDWYERQLRDEEEVEHRRMAAWVDDLTDDELKELQRARDAAGAGRLSLRAELAAYARAVGGPGS
ncbi:hypothetical protein [Streptomyces reticuliscabiei]|uniref:hypothetical protein n=1 Tax=Streptomyces reticuliscabiei TaxID=146821 RepID=UPI00117F513E|nr:hypothetical protein [Streptomyces reticuliscabiei]